MSENIHTFDEQSVETLKNMLYSSDTDSNVLAVEILKNVNTKDEATMSFIFNLMHESTVNTYNQNADTMKAVTELLVDYLKRGLIEFPVYTFDKSKEARTDIALYETAIIEYKFEIRKRLAKEWLEETTTPERKLEIEDEINVLNRYVANLMNVEYEDRH